MNRLILKFITIILVAMSSNYTQAQKSKLEVKSISIGLGIFDLSSNSSSGGLSREFDLSTKFNKHLFSFYLHFGSELNFTDADEGYKARNITYGRELKLNSWTSLEGHIGLGYFSYIVKNDSTDFETIQESTLGVPIRGKLIFHTNEHFALGMNPNINLNSLVNTYSMNLILQYNF